MIETVIGSLNRVLVIEDHRESRLLLARILTAAGAEVRALRDGLTVVRDHGDFRPDLVVVDLDLPLLDGFSVATTLKASAGFENVPIVAVSVLAGEEERELALAAGCDGFVPKPIDVDGIVKTLREYAGGRRDRLPPERERAAHVRYQRRLVEQLASKTNLILVDEVTGLYNRRYLFTRVEEEMARADRLGESFTFVRLKARPTGDPDELECRSLRRSIAETLLKNRRLFDVVAQIDDWEFGVILGRCPSACSSAVAERLIRAVETEACKGTEPALCLRVSFGFAVYESSRGREHSSSVERLFARAGDDPS